MMRSTPVGLAITSAAVVLAVLLIGLVRPADVTHCPATASSLTSEAAPTIDAPSTSRATSDPDHGPSAPPWFWGHDPDLPTRTPRTAHTSTPATTPAPPTPALPSPSELPSTSELPTTPVVSSWPVTAVPEECLSAGVRPGIEAP